MTTNTKQLVDHLDLTWQVNNVECIKLYRAKEACGGGGGGVEGVE